GVYSASSGRGLREIWCGGSTLSRVEWIEGYPYVKTEELDVVLKNGIKQKKIELNTKILDIVEEYKRKRMQEVKREALL
ncbi:MAG: hypothetical protein V3V81_02610, partial [Candidatus Bathyarchaeia archaeon]